MGVILLSSLCSYTKSLRNFLRGLSASLRIGFEMRVQANHATASRNAKNISISIVYPL